MRAFSTCSLRVSLLVTAITPDSASASELPSGIWQSKGYGYVASVGRRVEVFEVSRAGCVRGDRLSKSAFAGFYGEASREVDGQLVLMRGPTRDPLVPLEALPAACRKPLRGDDPGQSFEVFVATFEDYYPFFEQRGTNWDSVRDQARAQLSANPEAAFKALIDSLDDSHVALSIGDRELSTEIAVAREKLSREAGALFSGNESLGNRRKPDEP